MAWPRFFGNFARLAGATCWSALDPRECLHPDLDRDLHIRVRQNIEAIILHGFDRSLGNVGRIQLSGLDRPSDAIGILLRFRGWNPPSSVGRLRSEFEMPVSTNAGQRTETPIVAFCARSSW